MRTTGKLDVATLNDIRAEGMMVAEVGVCAAATVVAPSVVVAAAEGSRSPVAGREDQRHRLGAFLAGKVEYRCFV